MQHAHIYSPSFACNASRRCFSSHGSTVHLPSCSTTVPQQASIVKPSASACRVGAPPHSRLQVASSTSIGRTKSFPSGPSAASLASSGLIRSVMAAASLISNAVFWSDNRLRSFSTCSNCFACASTRATNSCSCVTIAPSTSVILSCSSLPLRCNAASTVLVVVVPVLEVELETVVEVAVTVVVSSPTISTPSMYSSPVPCGCGRGVGERGGVDGDTD